MALVPSHHSATPSLLSMLAQLATLKSRLALDPLDLTYDGLLVRAVAAGSARFEQETNRTLARTADFQQPFDARATELIAACYPVETISKFELKSSEAGGWIEQTNVEYLLRGNSGISLRSALSKSQSLLRVLRVTYTGGFLFSRWLAPPQPPPHLPPPPASRARPA